MTAEDISQLTLADLEAIAERFSGAVRTIREAQALLGGQPMANIPSTVSAPFQRIGPPPGEPPLSHLEEARLERAALLKSIRSSPERAAKLQQFAHDTEDESEMEG